MLPDNYVFQFQGSPYWRRFWAVFYISICIMCAALRRSDKFFIRHLTRRLKSLSLASWPPVLAASSDFLSISHGGGCADYDSRWRWGTLSESGGSAVYFGGICFIWCSVPIDRFVKTEIPSGKTFFFFSFFKTIVCVCTCIPYINECMQRPDWVWDVLDLELQVAVSHPTQVLRPELRTSIRRSKCF